jgi:anti-anti-sigma factor
MLDFEKQLSGDVLIEKVNLVRATFVEASIMKKRLLDDINLSKKKIIVDIHKCDFIDSTFLGVLVVSLKRTRATGGVIKLVTATFTGGIINLDGYQRIFEIYASVEDALKSFRPTSRTPQIELANHRDKYLYN